jgi:DNA-binding XRE family transcriptional regulator
MEKRDRLKILRLLNGCTQDILANRLGVPRTSIAMWEKGRYGFSSEITVKLASALGVQTDYLILGTPPIANAVWIPVPPSRPDYLRSMQEDFTTLLPQFLTENKYNASYSDSLADGSRFFLLGQDYDFGCLLIADARLADTINVGLKQTIDEDLITELEHKIDKLDGSVFEFVQSHWLPPSRLPQDFKRIDVVKLCQMLEKKRGSEDSGEKNDSLKLIYRTFNEVVRKYDVPDTAMDKLDELFVTKFKELSSVPSASIKVTSLMAEIGKALKNLGCQKRNEKQC